MDLSPGESLLHYRLAEKIGEGGMGAVWKATDTSLHREVAIKVLPDAFAADPERLARFQREARMLAALSHPHIAGIYSVHESGGIHFLAMELVAGEDLARRLSRGPLAVEETLEMAGQIAEGLEAAHESGVVHRDLKPANIQIGPGGKIKILDFGLAKALGAEASASGGGDLTHSPTITAFGTVAGVILGTAAYMSPEQARGRAVDRRADIWAFGCVLFEMLTGHVSFRGETVTDTLAAIVRAEPDWQALPAGTPETVRHLLRRCLDKNPATRLRDIGEARVALAGAASGIDSLAPGGAGGAEDRQVRRRSVSGPWALATVMLAALSLFLGIRLLQGPAAEPQRAVTFTVEPPAEGLLRSMGEVAAPVEVSPDGRLLLLGLMEPGGEHRLWVHSLDDGSARPLHGTNGATRPFWSPDSRSVAFFSNDELRRVDIAGGSARTIAPAPSGRGGSWSPQGVIVFTPNFIGPVYQVAADGGEATPVTGEPGPAFLGSHRYPSFLPDGRRFLFLSLGSGGATGVESESGQEVFVSSLDGETPRLLLRGVSNAVYAGGHFITLKGKALQALPYDPTTLEPTGEPWSLAGDVAYDRGFERAIFSASSHTLAYQMGDSANRSDLKWFDRQGKELGRLGLNLTQGNPAISPDGRYVAFFSAEEGPTNIWIHDLKRDLRTRFTFDTTQQILPTWSPDGTKLAYASSLDGHWAVVVKPLAGGEAETLLAGEISYLPLAWSADGRWLVISAESDNLGYDLLALDMSSGDEMVMLRDSRFNERLAALSPDGRWLAYSSDESGQNEVYITAFPRPEGKLQVSRSGGTDPVWAPDGRSLLYRDLFNVLRETTVTAGDPLPDLGAESVLFQTYSVVDIGGAAYDISPDGQRILVNAADETSARQPLTVRVNWRSSTPAAR